MTEKIKPVPFTWRSLDVVDKDGVLAQVMAMVPHPRFRPLCDRQYAVGEEYALVVNEEASTASRGHYFASLKEAWMNLPEEIAKQYPSVEYLRKKALVETGHATEHVVICDTETEAKRTANLARALSGYAVIVRSGNVVKIFEAVSQSAQAMNKEKFQKSKDDVLDYVSKLIGVNRGELQKAAGKSA